MIFEILAFGYVVCAVILFGLILRYEIDVSFAELGTALIFSPFILTAAVAGAMYFVARRLKSIMKATEALIDADLKRKFGDR